MTAPWNTNRNGVYRARGALKAFAARGIELPDEVTAAVATLDRITASIPAKPATDVIRNLIVGDADQDTINAALLADATSGLLHTEYKQAEIIAAERVLQALRDASDDLHLQLQVLAAEAIATLKTVAGLGETSLADLVRDGRHDDARALADTETVGQELQQLYELRNSALVPGGYRAMTIDGVDCTQWRDPRPVTHHGRGDDSVAQAYVRGLRSGGELWFPTKADALAAAQPVHAELTAEAEKAAQIRREQDAAAIFAG